MISAGILSGACEYLQIHHPPLYGLTLVPPFLPLLRRMEHRPKRSSCSVDAPEWKEFLCRPALKSVLRVLVGLCRGHEHSQTVVAADAIPIIHRLEQISTEQWLGSLAETLLEALLDNPKVAEKVRFVVELWC